MGYQSTKEGWCMMLILSFRSMEPVLEIFVSFSWLWSVFIILTPLTSRRENSLYRTNSWTWMRQVEGKCKNILMFCSETGLIAKTLRKTLRNSTIHTHFSQRSIKIVRGLPRNLEVRCYKKPISYYKTTRNYNTQSHKTESYLTLIFWCCTMWPNKLKEKRLNKNEKIKECNNVPLNHQLFLLLNKLWKILRFQILTVN